MKKPKICAVLTYKDFGIVQKIEKLVDLFEVRIDLIGDGWQELARQLNKPWIACNRNVNEGGHWRGDETKRIEELLKAIELGADIIDIELGTRDIAETIPLVKKRAECLMSFHDWKKTPSLDGLKEIVQQQLAAGADICKVVTTAQRFEDNITVLKLISEFPNTRLISFAMGTLGLVSRILCPLIGGNFTYGSVKEGKESASGQITVKELHRIYRMVTGC